MTIKKYTLLVYLLFAAATVSFAQLAGVVDYKDSSKVPASRMAQQTEWRNNSKTQIFPAMPRNQWQLGLYGGMFLVDGDCPPLPGWNVGLQARKALGYVVSLRGQIGYGEAKGLDYRKNPNLLNNDVLAVYQKPGAPNSIPSSQGPGFYIANFLTKAITPSVDILFSLNNIMFHKKSSKINWYGVVGYTAFIYQTKLDALNGSKPYAFNTLITNANDKFFMRERKEIRSDLKDYFDGVYETAAMVNDRKGNFNSSDKTGFQLRNSLNLGTGLEYKLTGKVSVGAELKYVMTFDDYIDGWTKQVGTMVLTPESDRGVYANISFNYNIGNPSKRVAPLWQLNPLGYIYGELSNPSIMKFPKPVLDDTDNDGVTDQFDIEPNTPTGCPVDVKGKSRDTDGDGVPDCRDKELITPTSCQPVDGDGVGKCPDPACCKNPPLPPTPVCNIGSLPSAQFASGSVKISNAANLMLINAAAQIKANPVCKICVVGHGGASKREQQLSWDRVNAVINFLVENQGVSRDRFVFKYGEDGDVNTVDLQDCSMEEGPNTVPAPHPQYRKN